jgi:hypothetical protein
VGQSTVDLILRRHDNDHPAISGALASATKLPICFRDWRRIRRFALGVLGCKEFAGARDVVGAELLASRP